MITVHHLNNSRSQRVLWLLEELALPYEIVRYQRDPKTMLAPPELRAIHPLGKSPVVTDDEGRTVAESGAIIEYLVDIANGTLRPRLGSPEYLRYRYFLHYAEGSVMPLMVMALVFGAIPRAPMPFFIKPIAKAIVSNVNKRFLKPQSDLHLAFLDAELAQRPWFAGDSFSAADVQMSFPLEAATVRAGARNHRHLADWLDRIHARPAYQRALERGGKYEVGSF